MQGESSGWICCSRSCRRPPMPALPARSSRNPRRRCGRATRRRAPTTCAARSTPAAELWPRRAAQPSCLVPVDRRRHGRWCAPGNGSARTAGSPTTDCRAVVRYRCSRPGPTTSCRRPTAISFRPFQKASSRLTLVLCPAITIERLMTGDFIARLPFRPGVGRDFVGFVAASPGLGSFRLCAAMGRTVGRGRLARLEAVWPLAGGSQIDNVAHELARR